MYKQLSNINLKNMSNDRILRVNELLLRELGNVFTREVSPAVPELVTVTGVKAAIDLRDATVFVSVYGKAMPKQDVLALLERKRPLIQSELAKKVILKYTPRLHFKLDETAENADRVMHILNELNLDEEKPDGDGKDSAK